MILELYYKMSTCSRRAIRRKTGRFNKSYIYRPRTHLISRLSEETGLSRTEVYNKLMDEREYILKNLSYWG
jgi:hypothetical protein